MKFDIQLEKIEDLEQFKNLFYKNIGTDSAVYNFYTGDVMVRVHVSGFERSQLINIGFFSFDSEKSHDHTTISLTQFNPLRDDRFSRIDSVQKLWAPNPDQAGASIHHTPEETEIAFSTIREVLRAVYKFNKLKAFL